MSELDAQNSNLYVDTINTNHAPKQNNLKLVSERKRKSNMQSEAMAKQLKNNYYDILDNDEECDQEYLQKFEKHVQETEKPTTSSNSTNRENTINNAKKPTTNSSDKESNINKEKAKNNNKPKKVPPINIFDVQPNELINFLKNGIKVIDFKIKEFSSKKISLFLSSMTDYIRVKAYLEKTKTKFFTFTPKELKTKTYLLKGLSADTDPIHVYDELCKFQNEELQFVKVNQFTTKKSEKEGYDLPIFLVQISGDSKVNELKKINGFLHRCVRWESLRKPEIPQCRRCQSFFHSAANCYLPPRCVKCKETHEIGKCSLSTVTTDEREKLYCVLCNKYGHPASYKGCEKYKEMQQKLRAKKERFTFNRSNKSSTHVNPNISFADVVQNNNTLNVDNNNPIQLALQELNKTMLNFSNQIINLQKQLQIQTARIDTIFTMLN